MHVLHLLLQIGAIVLVGRLLARAVRGLGQPAVIGEILAGIVLGPSVLGALWPAGMEALFPKESLPFLGMTSQLGLVFFMFLVGLEFDPALLRGQGRSSVLISNAGILVPLALGAGLSVPLHATHAPEGVSRAAFGLFLGAAMSVTAFPVLARILAERRLMKTTVGALALAAAAVDDVSAWCLIAFTVAVATASGLGSAVLTTALAAAYVAGMLFLVRPMLARLGPRAEQAPSRDTVAAVFVLVIASASLTEWIGVHALFGAFVAGAIMPRTGPLVPALEEKLEDFVTIVLLPLFFAYSGLRTRIGLLDSGEDWLLAGVILTVATVGKFGGTAIAARIAGLDARSSAAVGVLMNTRGLMELVVLNIGLDLGVLTEDLFAMMVVMALVTTWMTSPALARIFPHPAASTPSPDLPAAPTPRDARAVLLCVADAAVAESMVSVAAALTRAAGSVTALHLRPIARFSESMHGEQPTADDPLDAVREAAARRGLAVRTEAFPSALPSADILAYAERAGAGLVVLGAHRSLLRGDSFGGPIGAVLSTSDADVAVLIDRGLGEVRRVGVVPGEGAHADAVARIAERLRAGGAQVERVATPMEDAPTHDLLLAPYGAVPDDVELSLFVVHAGRGATACAGRPTA